MVKLALSSVVRVWLSGQAPACKAVYTGSNPVIRSHVVAGQSRPRAALTGAFAS